MISRALAYAAALLTAEPRPIHQDDQRPGSKEPPLRNITRARVERPVIWQKPSKPTEAQATFLTAWNGSELLFTELVRVQVGQASMGRDDAISFGQPVALWEALTADAVRAELL